MSATKEIATNFRVYYSNMKSEYTQKKEEAEALLYDLVKEEKEFYDAVKKTFEKNPKAYKYNLNTLEEFVKNEYIDGEFCKIAKLIFLNRDSDFKVEANNYELYQLAEKQKDVHRVKHIVQLYKKMSNLTLTEYTRILELYYNEVCKKLIIEGQGYSFKNNIGWICINRCTVENARPKLDFAATRKKKQEIINRGGIPYNDNDAKWCKENGIEYKGEDYRVYLNEEYCYEIPLLQSKLTNGTRLKFTTTDRTARDLRGKSDEELIEMCGRDKNKICELGIGIRHKLKLCMMIDKGLFNKYIRNENQTSSKYRKINRKNR